MSQPQDDESPLSPQESLQLISRQQHRTYRLLGADPLPFWGPWGAAWFIGFGLFFLKYGLNGRSYVDMPVDLPLMVMLGLIVTAMAFTMIYSVRSNRHIQGTSNIQGMMFGFAWFFGFLSVIAIAVRLGPMLPGYEGGLLWAALSVGMTGTLYIAGGAIWTSWPMFIMGAWLNLVNAVGIALGPGWHAVLCSLFAGGGLLVAGLIFHFRAVKAST